MGQEAGTDKTLVREEFIVFRNQGDVTRTKVTGFRKREEVS